MRETVDVTGYPDLVVIYLGMRVRKLRGLRTLARSGPRIQRSVAAQPDGLLRHENLVYSLFPLHVGMRQYWRDFDALEAWARTDPHRSWWTELLADPGGTGFWHETYSMRGGIEAIYLDMTDKPLGIGGFAPREPARKSMFSARSRLRGDNADSSAPPVVEEEFYAD
jgi:hypothetical protein